MRAAAFLALLIPLGGCELYFGSGDDDDDDCLNGGAAEPGVPAIGQRNPWTGECVYQGGGIPPCSDEPPPDDGFGAPWYDADWGYCYFGCESLGESDCLAADGCRAIYIDAMGFGACWSTALSGPIRGGGCVGLDAEECSRHDDCTALHELKYCPPDSLCAPEPGNWLACQDGPPRRRLRRRRRRRPTAVTASTRRPAST
jgi:hypothetical protein